MPAAVVLAGLARRRSIWRAVVAAVSGLFLAGALAFCAAVAVLGAKSARAASVCSPASPGSSPVASAPATTVRAGTSQPTLNLTARQTAVAEDYVSIGKQLGVPRDGQVIAIMMALQESSLRVLANANVPASLSYPNDGVGRDHDSLGSAQQRPAAGWGTIEQLMDSTYNVRAFYGGPNGPNHGSPRGLLDIRGWQSMTKGQAAQAVQVSAFPELYARWEAEATAIVDALDDGTAPVLCGGAPNLAPMIPEPANLSVIRKDILRFTLEGVGGTYVWGGTAFKAWDCSGYVQWIYRQAGINPSDWRAPGVSLSDLGVVLIAESPLG